MKLPEKLRLHSQTPPSLSHNSLILKPDIETSPTIVGVLGLYDKCIAFSHSFPAAQKRTACLITSSSNGQQNRTNFVSVPHTHAAHNPSPCSQKTQEPALAPFWKSHLSQRIKQQQPATKPYCWEKMELNSQAKIKGPVLCPWDVTYRIRIQTSALPHFGESGISGKAKRIRNSLAKTSVKNCGPAWGSGGKTSLQFKQ